MALIKRNWDSLWHPAPANCASDFRHSYVRGADRSRTKTALERVDRVSVADLSSLLDDIARARKSEHKLENEIAQLEGISPQIEMKANELKELNGHIDRLQAEKGRLERELEVISAQLNQKRAELRRYVESMDRTGPSIRRARWADTVKDALTAR